MSVNRYVCSLNDLRKYLNITPANVAFSIYCTATDATAATVQIGGNSVILTITGGAYAGTNTLNYTSSYAGRTTWDTFGEMADYINALNGWYAYLYGASSGDVLTLADVPATDVLGVSKLLFIGTTNSQFSTNNLNATLTKILEGVTVAFERFLHRKLDTQETTEYYDGPGDSELILKNYPISAIDSIYIDQNWSWGSTTLVDSDNYTFDPGTGIVLYQAVIWEQRFGGWTKGRRNIKITYTYGWTEIPEDIQLEGIKVAAIEYLKSVIGGARIGIMQETRRSTQVDSKTISYDVKDLPSDTKDRLKRYKRTVMV